MCGEASTIPHKSTYILGHIFRAPNSRLFRLLPTVRLQEGEGGCLVRVALNVGLVIIRFKIEVCVCLITMECIILHCYFSIVQCE